MIPVEMLFLMVLILDLHHLVFSALRKLNRANTCNIQSLSVGTKTYHGDCVPDGIFNSIKDLETEPIETVHSDDFPDFNEEY